MHCYGLFILIHCSRLLYLLLCRCYPTAVLTLFCCLFPLCSGELSVLLIECPCFFHCMFSSVCHRCVLCLMCSRCIVYFAFILCCRHCHQCFFRSHLLVCLFIVLYCAYNVCSFACIAFPLFVFAFRVFRVVAFPLSGIDSQCVAVIPFYEIMIVFR